MPRLFTAIEIPNDFRVRLSLLRAPLTGARWIEADNMHLTLRFVGDVTDREADDFARALDDVRAGSFEIRVSGAGAFGGHSPTVIYANVEHGDALDALRRQHERAARAVGFAPEAKPFKPHITLARLRHVRAAPVARFLEECGDLRLGPILVTRFALMSARPGTGGGPYAIEETYDLSPALVR